MLKISHSINIVKKNKKWKELRDVKVFYEEKNEYDGNYNKWKLILKNESIKVIIAFK
jgi:hypothetical protein